MIALIIVDVQNDFVEGGALAVAGGKSLIPGINALAKHFQEVGGLVVTTQDWHPTNTAHFSKWPVHCMAFSRGAAFADGLVVPPTFVQLKKGQSATDDGYSAFEAVDAMTIALHEILKQNDVDNVYVCGIATDYCVRATVMDAVKYGYKTTLVENLCAGVAADTTDKAIAEMYGAGVQFATINVEYLKR